MTKGQRQRPRQRQRGQQLPTPPPPGFVRRKARILELLAVPEAEYSDASPKGSVDAGIRELIDEINAVEGFVTTSSCAGRVSVFVEGCKDKDKEKEKAEDPSTGSGAAGGFGIGEGEGEEARDPVLAVTPAGKTTTTTTTTTTTVAAVGGKGGGGAWLFVSHDPITGLDGVDGRDIKKLLGLRDPEPAVSPRGEGVLGSEGVASAKDIRLIHFKFEPMILHVLTASPEHAQLLLLCGLQAGFRESGAINLLPTPTPTSTTSSTSTPGTETAAEEGPTPIVAIRSMGLSLESLIGIREDGVTTCTVSDAYLATLLRVANERFVENARRIERFRSAFLKATASIPPPSSTCSAQQETVSEQGSEGVGKMMRLDNGTEWEDADVRRERKRAEGLKRKAELERNAKEKAEGGDQSADVDLALFPTDPNLT